MPVLKYWDGSQWQVLASGGGSEEVAVQTDTPTAANIELWVDTDAEQPVIVQSVTPGRNKIINGDFSVNQRGFVASAVTGYGLDRWLFDSNGACTYSVQAAVVGELPEASRYFARMVSTHSGGDPYSVLLQKIEGSRTLSGKTATVSFWARAASGTPKVGVELQQNFAGSSFNIQLGAVTLSTTWTRYSLTVAVPSVAGKTINAGDFLSLLLWISSGATYAARASNIGIQSGTFDFWGVQVEEGNVMTPFEQKSYADELRACQRYFTRFGGDTIYNYIGSGSAFSATTAQIYIPFPVPMRVPPGVVTIGTMRLTNGTNSIPLNSAVTVAPSYHSRLVAAINVGVASGLTGGGFYSLDTNNSSGTVIDFSAEL